MVEDTPTSNKHGCRICVIEFVQGTVPGEVFLR
jgi:hypothetical protein